MVGSSNGVYLQGLAQYNKASVVQVQNPGASICLVRSSCCRTHSGLRNTHCKFLRLYMSPEIEIYGIYIICITKSNYRETRTLHIAELNQDKARSILGWLLTDVR